MTTYGPRPPRVEELLAAAVTLSGLSREEILSKSQAAPVVEARRQIAIALYDTGTSSTLIGLYLNREHTVVLRLMGKHRQQFPHPRYRPPSKAPERHPDSAIAALARRFVTTMEREPRR